MWISQYLTELCNVWLGWAAAMLTAVELGQFFLRKTWGWPAEHPWRVAVVLLAVAQVGAYKELQDQTQLELGRKTAVIDTVNGSIANLARIIHE